MEVWRFEKRDWVVVVIPWGTMGGQCSVCSFLGHPLVEQRYIRNTGRATGFFCAWRRLAGGVVMLGPEGRHGKIVVVQVVVSRTRQSVTGESCFFEMIPR